MTPSTPQRDLLLRYLLHRVEPLEREEVDTRLIADPDFAAAFQEAQNNLVDDYAAGVLSAEDEAQVRQAMLANAAFSRAVQMAAAFKLSNWQPRTPAKQGSRFRVPSWAVAACAILINTLKEMLWTSVCLRQRYADVFRRLVSLDGRARGIEVDKVFEQVRMAEHQLVLIIGRDSLRFYEDVGNRIARIDA